MFTQAEDGTLTFHRLPPPEDRDIARLCGRIRARVLALLDPKAEDISPDDEDIALAAAQAGAVDPPPAQLALIDVQEPAGASAQKPLTAFNFGFSLNAGLAVNQHSRADLERLLRYGNRPAFSQKRLSLTPQGRVRLKLRKPTADGRTELCTEPLDFLRRLAALVSCRPSLTSPDTMGYLLQPFESRRAQTTPAPGVYPDYPPVFRTQARSRLSRLR